MTQLAEIWSIKSKVYDFRPIEDIDIRDNSYQLEMIYERMDKKLNLPHKVLVKSMSNAYVEVVANGKIILIPKCWFMSRYKKNE